jgi:hypothetical protein
LKFRCGAEAVVVVERQPLLVEVAEITAAEAVVVVLI